MVSGQQIPQTPKTSAIPPGLRVDTSRDKAFCIENEISKMQQSIADAKSKKTISKNAALAFNINFALDMKVGRRSSRGVAKFDL